MRLKPTYHPGKRYGVVGFIPPENIAAIASERTEGMADMFLAEGTTRDFDVFRDQLRRLARSCYMQGMNDAIDAAARLHAKQQQEAKEPTK